MSEAQSTARTRPLRILLLAPQPFFAVRGTPLAVRSLAVVLSELGHEVDLLSFPQGEKIDLPGVRLLRSMWLPVGRVRPGFSFSKLILDVPFLLESAARLIAGRYDVVHAVEEAAHLMAPLVSRWRSALVVDVDSSIPEQLRNARIPACESLIRIVNRMERHAFRNAVAVITICSRLTDHVRSIAPQTAVFQIEDPPLVDGDSLPGPKEAAALRAELNLGTGPVVLYTGNFERYQGVEMLVTASARLPGAQIVLMGGEPGEIAALKSHAVVHGCLPRCHFIGKRSPAELPRFLALADVLVSPRCLGGNTPFKIYTYLASGKPLVATRIPSHTQLLDDTLATLVDPDPDALVAGIQNALADPLAAVERAVRGRALIERKYGPRRFRDKVAEAYAHVERSLVRGETA
ncbi:MAG: glycosyltransferase [Vicinamibacteria bacterium]|nr:glycosyltransferase [Vicinamibacteria bacterium]